MCVPTNIHFTNLYNRRYYTEKIQDVILTESLFQFSDTFSISNFIIIVLYYYVTDILNEFQLVIYFTTKI